MRPIAERLLFREAAPAELWILHRADEIAISIDDIYNPCNAD